MGGTWYFYTYIWTNSDGKHVYSSNVFDGCFYELCLFTQKQPESWRIIYAKEISCAEYSDLYGNF